jgi:hypothetical protein
VQLERITATLTADASQFVNGMQQAKRALGSVGTASAQTNRAMGVLKNGMVGLAAQATGTTGPVAKLAQGLLMFGGGSGAVLGVAAGLGAIAIAYQELTRDAREAAKANNDLLVALGKISAHGRFSAERQKLETLQEQLGIAEAGTHIGGADFDRVIVDTKEVARLKGLIQKQTEAVAFWEREASREVVHQLGVIGMVAFQEERRVAALKDGLAVMVRMKEVEQDFAQAGKSFLGWESGIKKELSVAGLKGEAFAEQLEKVKLKEFFPPDDELQQLGMSVGRQLAMGLMEGFQNMQDVMRSIFSAVLSFALGRIFGAIIGGAVGGPAGAVAGGVAGGKFSGSVIAPASFSLNVTGGLSPAATPFAAARDAEWQRFLRESFIVATDAGFRR